MWPALLLVTDNAAVVIGLQLLVVVPAAAAASVANATLAELFPTQVRALGVAFPYAISVALFGGTAPFVMTYLAGNGHVSLLALYGTALLALTTVAILAMRERSQQPLISAAPDHSDPSQGRFSTDLAPNGPPTTRP
jgi:MHS family alpha-ketoglutarate permease-like MFS transporter